MANRVTDEEVKEILDAKTTVGDTTPFITAANQIVTDRLVGKGLSTDQLKEIERWLAAHLTCSKEQQPGREKAGEAEATYRGKDGLGLDTSLYGQNVKLLDSSGTLSSLGKRGAFIEAIDFVEE